MLERHFAVGVMKVYQIGGDNIDSMVIDFNFWANQRDYLETGSSFKVILV